MPASVYVVFTTKKGSLLSRLICAVTKSDVSHSILAFRSEEWDGWVTLGADIGGWRILPVETIAASNHIVTVFELPHHDLGVALKRNRKYLGSPYGFWELLGMAWVVFNSRVLGRRVPNPVNYDDAWFCSEIVNQILYDAGLDLGIAHNTVDPDTLRRLLRESRQVTEIPALPTTTVVAIEKAA